MQADVVRGVAASRLGPICWFRLHLPRQVVNWVAVLLLTAVAIGCQRRDEPEAAGKPGFSESDLPASGSDRAKDPAGLVPDSPAGDAGQRSPAASTEATPAGPNHLRGQTSLYLRMHVNNPVDWYPWGEQALAKAKRENKPIFLSIGYSSCHWCHVMERESFLDPQIAQFLNRHFVCIKVDREERPDVDAIYMTAVQLLTGGGGWPMSVFLTPDGRPFFGGTYFPARDGDRPGATGFLTVIEKVAGLWGTDEAKIRESAEQLTRVIQRELEGQLALEPATFGAQLVLDVLDGLEKAYDSQYGGFHYQVIDDRRPKFPEPSNLLFLHYALTDGRPMIGAEREKTCGTMLLTTLDRMARGGIYDHLAGGFHRYSVDRFWRVPHFEKMLYDNGQLLSVYGRTLAVADLGETQRWQLHQVVRRTGHFLLEEMRGEQGGFFAAIDAESEHVEGKYYRWQREEVREILGDDYELFAPVYGLDGPPNFDGQFYVLQAVAPWSELADAAHMSVLDLEMRLAPMREKLLAHRRERPRPLVDQKVLTDWNGLAIRGLADAGRGAELPELIKAGEQAASFLLRSVRDREGRLLHVYNEGEAHLPAYLDDYAFLVDGLIGLHQATGDAKWLEMAAELTEEQIKHFWDERQGGFFFTADDHETLIVRLKQWNDGARPAGNSVAAENLLYLAEHLDRPRYVRLARRTVEAAVPRIRRTAVIAPRLTIAAGRTLSRADEDAAEPSPALPSAQESPQHSPPSEQGSGS